MAIIKCERMEDDRGVKTDTSDRGSYEKKWKVIVDDDGHCGLTVLELSRLVTTPNDPVPNHGDSYADWDGEDQGAFAQDFDCKLQTDGEPLVWIITVKFSPLGGGEKNSKQRVQESNPLKWTPEYWVEFVEEQVPIEEARCMGTWKLAETGPYAGIKEVWFSLEAIKRGPYYAQIPSGVEYDKNALPLKGEQRLPKKGPIVNGAGQQTVDPQTKMEFRTIICAQLNCPSYLDAIILNNRWMNSTNSETFLGAPPRSWKFLGALPDKRQEKEVPGIGTVEYYPTTVKLEFKKEYDLGMMNGWDLKLLNNGQVCVRKVVSNGVIQDNYVIDPETHKPALFPVQVRQLTDEAVTLLNDDPETTLEEDHFEYVDSNEPMNLNWNGTPLKNPEDKAQHIYYRYLDEKDYTDMTYNNGFQQISIW